MKTLVTVFTATKLLYERLDKTHSEVIMFCFYVTMTLIHCQVKINTRAFGSASWMSALLAITIILTLCYVGRQEQCQLYFLFNWNTRHFTEFVIIACDSVYGEYFVAVWVCVVLSSRWGNGLFIYRSKNGAASVGTCCVASLEISYTYNLYHSWRLL